MAKPDNGAAVVCRFKRVVNVLDQDGEIFDGRLAQSRLAAGNLSAATSTGRWASSRAHGKNDEAPPPACGKQTRRHVASGRGVVTEIHESDTGA